MVILSCLYMFLLLGDGPSLSYPGKAEIIAAYGGERRLSQLTRLELRGTTKVLVRRKPQFEKIELTDFQHHQELRISIGHHKGESRIGIQSGVYWRWDEKPLPLPPLRGPEPEASEGLSFALWNGQQNIWSLLKDSNFHFLSQASQPVKGFHYRIMYPGTEFVFADVEIDRQTHLITAITWWTTPTEDHNQKPSRYLCQDYRSIEGLMIPFRMEKEGYSRFELSEVRINPVWPEGLFDPPRDNKTIAYPLD